MACTSPNQWALASPTASSSSRSSRAHLASGDRQDEAGDVDLHDDADRGDALLGHVRQLIVDLLVDEGGRSSSFRLSEAAAPHDALALEQAAGRGDAKRRSNNPEAEEDASIAVATARERLMEEKLARVLLELAAEQDNLRLAANAGNALLEELSTAREEIDALHDELEAAQLDRDRAVRDAQRLHEQNAALETELQRYDAPYSSWDSTGQQNALSHLQQRQQQQRRPSITSRSGSFSRTDSCERCASREVELTQLEQRADELRRRCLELELVREREQQRQRELCEEITQLQQRNNDHHLETARAQQDLEFVTSQLEQQTQEVERVQAVRDTLRRTARRLEAENEDLQARLAARDELVAKLESSNSARRHSYKLQRTERRVPRPRRCESPRLWSSCRSNWRTHFVVSRSTVNEAATLRGTAAKFMRSLARKKVMTWSCYWRTPRAKLPPCAWRTGFYVAKPQRRRALKAAGGEAGGAGRCVPGVPP